MELQSIPTDSITDTGKAFLPPGRREGSSVWSVSPVIAETVLQGRRKSYKRLTNIQTRGTFRISTITADNISP
jgi:hypothetical protein